jgi:hypothetical protein
VTPLGTIRIGTPAHGNFANLDIRQLRPDGHYRRGGGSVADDAEALSSLSGDLLAMLKMITTVNAGGKWPQQAETNLL